MAPVRSDAPGWEHDVTELEACLGGRGQQGWLQRWLSCSALSCQFLQPVSICCSDLKMQIPY